MSKLRRVGNLDITQDLNHEDKENRIQWICWGIVLLVLAGALAGLFGGGPLSSAVAGQEQGGIHVEYERFERRHSESRLRVRVAPAIAHDGAVRLWISRSFLERVSVDRIEPEPASRALASDRTLYVFPVSSSTEAYDITLFFRADRVGPLKSSLGVENGPELHLWQFVYP